MRTVIETDSDSELTIQRCATTITSNIGTHRTADQICIMIRDTTREEEIQGENSALAFLTKQQARTFISILQRAVDEI